jgi:hypothetical protein
MDALVIAVQTLKATIEITVGFLLLNKWKKHFPRFISDLPFIFGLLLVLVGIGESMDVFMDSGVLLALLEFQKIRISFVIAGLTLLFYSLFQIWTPKKRWIKIIGAFSYGGSWTLLHLLAPSREIVYLISAGYFALCSVPYFVTFILVYRYQRLPEVDARFILLSTSLLFIGQVFKTWFLVNGILWISEAIDLLGWAMIFVGFNHPAPYALTKSTTLPSPSKPMEPSRI